MSLSLASIDKLGDRLVVASVSGGKDSTALALALRELGVPHVRAFADTGFEAPETYAYLDHLRARLGPIDVVRNESLWTGARPGEEGMLTLIRRKQMFPSRLMRFCTQKLKLHPIRDYVRTLQDRGDDIVNAVGVRAAESAARARMPEWEFWDEMDVDIWRPLLHWSEQDVIDIHRRHDLAPNPLYLAGARRVDCNPCIHARKADLRRLPQDQLIKIRRVEQDLTADANARGCERPTRAFFQVRGPAGALQFTPIDEVVRLAHLRRGRPILEDPEPPGCVRWGLCDASSPEPQDAPALPAVPEPPRVLIREAELARLGLSPAIVTQYVAAGLLVAAGDGDYARTDTFDAKIEARRTVGRGHLLALGVTPTTIARLRRHKVLQRTEHRGFYTISQAALESIHDVATGAGTPPCPVKERAPDEAVSPAPEPPTSEHSAPPPAPGMAASGPEATTEAQPPVARLRIVPCTITQARAFVRQHHRHHRPPQSGLFAVGLARGDELVGAAIVGRPVARALQDGATVEVTRVCTRGDPNACSMLLAACRRTAVALGYRRVITYTLASEPGTSLRAAGWQQTATVRGRSWHCPSRPRQGGVLADKRRWEAALPPRHAPQDAGGPR